MPDHKNMELESLVQLIVDAQSGNPKSQEELYKRFKPMICKMTRSMNRGDREDAQQELIHELFLAVQRFEPCINRET